MFSTKKSAPVIDQEVLLKAFALMNTAKSMADIYEENSATTSKYVHATSRGHEAIQLACGLQLTPRDFVAPYYRDDSILLGIGMSPYECMLQLFAKREDPFSGGRTYYSHPSLRDEDKPKIAHQSSATGMQLIPTTGIALGLKYRLQERIDQLDDPRSIVVCSLGDAAITEGEVAEAFQMAALKQLPIVYLVQDNGWDISANAQETRAQNAAQYAEGFKGIEVRQVDGADFEASYLTLKEVFDTVRKEQRPFLVHATVPLLGHHTSGVRKEWYRDDLPEHAERDPLPRFRRYLAGLGVKEDLLKSIEKEGRAQVEQAFEQAAQAEDPRPEDLFNYDFKPTPVTEEKGNRQPAGRDKIPMVDAALFGIQEIMYKHPEALLYGQDVGARLGGVFREAATLAQKFGDNRVFNTPIQEAFIIGSTVGMSAVGLKPFVEVQFADYIWPGLNQLFTEVSRSYYLSNGKWPVSTVIRVPLGAYGSGGPYHSSSIESVLTNIRGIKIAYPSTAADLKGLMKAAYYDPNPVVMLEHKGLYWSKVKGTEDARTVEPDEDYILPFGKGRIAYPADAAQVDRGNSLCIITYGMGVYWSKEASRQFDGKVEIVDLRTLYPLDEALIKERVQAHGRCLVVTEEPVHNSFAQALAGRLAHLCFEALDAPIAVIGSENMPAIPLNSTLEATMLPNASKVTDKIREVLQY